MAEAEEKFIQFVCKGSDVARDEKKLRERFPFQEGDNPYQPSPECAAHFDAKRAYREANGTQRVVLEVLGDDDFGPATNCPRREVTPEGDNCRTLVPTAQIGKTLLQRDNYHPDPKGGHPITHSLEATYKPCDVSAQVRAQLGLKKVADAIDWEKEYDIGPSGYEDRGRTEYSLAFKKKGSNNFGHDYRLIFAENGWHPDQATIMNNAVHEKGFEIESAVAWANKNYPKPDPTAFPVEKSTPDKPLMDPLNFGL